MRIRLVLASAALLALAACSESTTAPTQLRPTGRSNDETLTCRSGYHIATRADGTEVCEPDVAPAAAASTTTTAAAPTS